MTKIETVDRLAARIPDGAFVGLPPEYSYVPMELVRALVRRGARNLDVICVPIGGMAVDLLVGAGCVRSIEAAAISLAESGLAPRFTEAVQERRVKMKDSTCPAVHTALQASEKGVPFMPLSGLIGSDILNHRNDWKVVDDPLGKGGGPIALVPAIQPEFALIHSPLGDRFGNVWVGKRRELMTLAHASKETLVTVERIVDEDLLLSETTAAGTLSSLYVSAIAEAEGGAKPLGLPDCYERDESAIGAYARAAKTQQGFDDYLISEGINVRTEAAE
jgi:glutaconate CoA-transferase, subunit A